MEYEIHECRNNVDIDFDHPSCFTFDVLTEYDGTKKWLSIPHELYFAWIVVTNDKLSTYIENRNFKDFLAVIKDLDDLEFDWKQSMKEYVEKFYTKKVFLSLPAYHPDQPIEFDEDEEF